MAGERLRGAPLGCLLSGQTAAQPVCRTAHLLLVKAAFAAVSRSERLRFFVLGIIGVNILFGCCGGRHCRNGCGLTVFSGGIGHSFGGALTCTA